MNQFTKVRDKSLGPTNTSAFSSVFGGTTPPLINSTLEDGRSFFEVYIMYFLSHFTGWNQLDVGILIRESIVIILARA